MLFQWFYHASRRGSPRFLMVADHMNYLTFEDPAAVNLCRRALKLALAGDHYGAAETANVTYPVAEAVGAALRRGFRFSIGAEVDNDPRNRPDAQNIVEAMRPDGLVRSVHFLPITHPEHGEGWMWPFDNPEFKDLYLHVGVEQTWELYASAVVDAVEKLPGNILGHFFVPGKFGFWPSDAKLEEYEDRVIAACRQRGMAIEFNTRVLYKSDDPALVERWLAAHRRLLRKAKAADVGIAVGSDAHSPMHQGAAFERVLAMLDELGINELVFPVAGRLARVALKASEELIAAVAQPVTPLPGSSITGLGRKELGLPEEPEVSIASRNEEARAARRRGGRVARATRERPSTAKPARTTPSPAERTAKPSAVKPGTPAKKKAAPVPKAGAKTPPAAAKKAAEVSKKTAAPAKKAAAATKRAVAPARKAAPVKKAATKKPAATKKTAAVRKSAAKKAPVKKAAAARKSAPAKRAAAPAKKAAVKKTAAKKAVAKKATAKRSAPPKKSVVKRNAAAKKASAGKRKR